MQDWANFVCTKISLREDKYFFRKASYIETIMKGLKVVPLDIYSKEYKLEPRNFISCAHNLPSG